MKTPQQFIDALDCDYFLGGYNKPCISVETSVLIEALDRHNAELISKKYEYIEKYFFNESSFDLIKTLNDMADKGNELVVCEFIPMLDNSGKVWKYHAIFKKEI